MSTTPIRLALPVAWGDMDAFQHVNNTVYLRWMESARIAYFERLELANRMLGEGIGPILARTEIDYRRPVTYPDTVTIAVGVTRVGSSSFAMSYTLTSEKQGGAVVAEGHTVQVLINYGTGEKVPLDAEGRPKLAAEASEPIRPADQGAGVHNRWWLYPGYCPTGWGPRDAGPTDGAVCAAGGRFRTTLAEMRQRIEALQQGG
jgi:acyl-CoA thioester hydrolase